MDMDASLMEFRTAWLRAVAQTWTDRAFHEALVSNPIGALASKFGFQWKWKDTLDFKVRSDPRFAWVGDDWTWPADEAEDSLTLRLPIRQPAIEPGSRARALAEYYHLRPSVFGNPSATIEQSVLVPNAATPLKDPNVGETRTGTKARAGEIEFAGHQPPRNGFVPNASSFMDFQVVLLWAIGKAWENEGFAKLLLTNESLASALGSIRGYALPWRLHIVVKDDETASFDASGSGGWKGLSRHELSLNLPAPPKEVRDQSIALAAYNGTGAEFPFTCCA